MDSGGALSWEVKAIASPKACLMHKGKEQRWIIGASTLLIIRGCLDVSGGVLTASGHWLVNPV
jgi:hypothetical protein